MYPKYIYIYIYYCYYYCVLVNFRYNSHGCFCLEIIFIIIYLDFLSHASITPYWFQEIKVLSKLKHPNIVQYYGSEIVSILPVACLDVLNIAYCSILEAMYEINVMHVG